MSAEEDQGEAHADWQQEPDRPVFSRAFHSGPYRSANTSPPARRFYQRRVQLLARFLAVIFGALTIVAAIAVAITMPKQFWAVHTHVGKLLTYPTLALWVLVVRVLRKPDRPRWVVVLCDAATVVPMCMTVGYGLAHAPPTLPLHFAGLLVGMLVLAVRAALVPSRPIVAMLVAAGAGLPILVGGYVHSLTSPFPGFTPVVDLVLHAGWWAAITATTTFVSRTIYGLVTQVSRVTRLGQYTLIEKIGEGGMGEVYRAQHAMLRRPTAVKLMSPSHASPETLRRFEREVQLTSRLAHPNTIAIYDYGRTLDGVFYYAMEYLDGLSLERLVHEHGPQPAGRVVQIVAQVAEALGEAHALGLIHRDIKPANIMLCDRGGIPDLVKVLDFGLVKDLEGASPETLQLTGTTSLTGTPLYMSPEAITHRDLDGRADLYALGAVAYFLLTGTPPFVARTVFEICAHHLYTQPESPSQRLGAPLPATVEALVLRCLAKDPAARPAGARELHDALTACRAEAGWSREEARAFWNDVARKGRAA
jgi:hypothetical protein